eukprot:2400074-Amphidinium_carterae.1
MDRGDLARHTDDVHMSMHQTLARVMTARISTVSYNRTFLQTALPLSSLAGALLKWLIVLVLRRAACTNDSVAVESTTLADAVMAPWASW